MSRGDLSVNSERTGDWGSGIGGLQAHADRAQAARARLAEMQLQAVDEATKRHERERVG